jgi:hypothetical protein
MNSSINQVSTDFSGPVKMEVRQLANDECWNCQVRGPVGIDVCHILAKEDNAVCSYIPAILNQS